MKILKFLSTATLLSAVLPGGASAQSAFNGAVDATAVVAPNAGCAPLPFQGLANGNGTSNFGAFAYSHTVCTQGATGAVTGTFLANFGIDQFQGTLNGQSLATSTPGIFDQSFNFMITGGTGRFLGAAGNFTSVGTVDSRTPPPHIHFNFQGLVNASALPEPTTWAMMLIGFGAIGGALRRAPKLATRMRLA